MEFIGDLSENDADLLESYANSFSKILEFGSGGSTQIFAQCLPKVLVSVETDPFWIERTIKNLEMFEEKTNPVFVPYDAYPVQEYDLIFVDGVWDKRLDFAIKTWPLLDKHGVMIFHDTRRWFDAENAFRLCAKFYDEIDCVIVNENDSNCTIIMKCPRIEYVNWNETEGKPKWAYGIGEKPVNADVAQG